MTAHSDHREGEAPAEPKKDSSAGGSAGASPSRGTTSGGSAGASPSRGSTSGGSAGASPSRGSPNDQRLPQRKRPAHGVFSRGSSLVIVFLTVCTKDRMKWIATPDCHGLLVDVWKGATGWLVGRYVLMPDHVHMFVASGEMDVDLENWVRFWKSMFTKRHRQSDHRWQSGYWDTRLRGKESYEEKWEYVRNNPVRRGLVERTEDWPFQGEIHTLEW